jgi:hypothetical protein
MFLRWARAAGPRGGELGWGTERQEGCACRKRKRGLGPMGNWGPRMV